MHRKINKRKILYLIIFFVCIFIYTIDMFMIYNHVDINKRKRNSFISNYTESSNIDYQIELLDNEYIKDENIGNSNTYIFKYTNAIDYNIKYDYSTSNNIDTLAEYEIYTIISGKYKKSTDNYDEIYTKKIMLASGKINSISNQISLNKNIIIDINNYNKILEDLQEDIKLPMTGELTLYLDVKIKNNQNEDINTYQNKATMSLLSDIYTITLDNKDTKTNSIYSDNLEINYPYLIILGIIFIIITFISLILIKKIIEKNIPMGLKQANKILKQYDDYIVNTKSKLDEREYKIIYINEFKEILTLAINNNKSIMYYKDKNKCIFYIIIDKNLYKYILYYE